MLPYTFKELKHIPYVNKISETLATHYMPNSFNEKTKSFLTELEQTHSMIENMNSPTPQVQVLKSKIAPHIAYLNSLLLLMKKVSFKGEGAPSITFSASDTLKSSGVVNLIKNAVKSPSSQNIYFIYYSVMYNLAVLYYTIASISEKDKMLSEDQYKEITKYYRCAAGLFQKIREEIPKKVAQKELTTDMQEDYLNFYEKICLIQSQVILIKIAESKKTAQKSQSELCYGVAKLFKEAKELYKKGNNSKYIEGYVRDYLSNRGHFYKGMMFIKLKEAKFAEFDSKGVGYGEFIVYLSYALEELKICSKTISKCSKLLNVEEFNQSFRFYENELKEAEEKNLKIYHEGTPDKKSEVYEAKIMVTPMIPEELKNEESEDLGNDLDSIIPNEVSKMLTKYKEEVGNYLNQNFAQLQSEDKVLSFINSLNLPSRYFAKERSTIKGIQIEDELWERIKSVQERGGAEGIVKVMQIIMMKNKEMEAKLTESLNLMGREQQEDNYYRSKAGDKWIREPSQKLNGQIIQNIQTLLNNILQSRKFDQKEQSDVAQNVKYYEQISQSRETLTANVPGNSADQRVDSLSGNEQDLVFKVEELKSLSTLCENTIKECFAELNNDPKLAAQFLKVISAKTTEAQILEENKVFFENKVSKLKELSSDVSNKEQEISDIYKSISKEKEEEIKTRVIPENVKNYFHNLDTYVQMFNGQYEKINKGLNYYQNLERKLEELIGVRDSYLKKREEEKGYLIQLITGKPAGIPAKKPIQIGDTAESGFLDPNKNLITNMNVNDFRFGTTFAGVRPKSERRNMNNKNDNQNMGCQNLPSQNEINQQFNQQQQFSPRQQFNQQQYNQQQFNQQQYNQQYNQQQYNQQQFNQQQFNQQQFNQQQFNQQQFNQQQFNQQQFNQQQFNQQHFNQQFNNQENANNMRNNVNNYPQQNQQNHFGNMAQKGNSNNINKDDEFPSP